MLYCFDIGPQMVSGVSRVKDRTAGTFAQIDIEPRWVLIGEDIDFIPWYARPVDIISKYRLWYETPSGDRWGLLAGQPVDFFPITG